MDAATMGLVASAGGAVISALVLRSVQLVDVQLSRLTERVGELAEHRADHAARLDSLEGRLSRLEAQAWTRRETQP